MYYKEYETSSFIIHLILIFFLLYKEEEKLNSLDFNGVSLIGNVANISEIKTLPNGKKYRLFDLCQNSKYKNSIGEDVESQSYYCVRLYDEQIEKYDSIIEKGKWIHIIGRLRNYLNKDMVKKTYIAIDRVSEMQPRKDNEIFDYDWLNDPDL